MTLKEIIVRDATNKALLAFFNVDTIEKIPNYEDMYNRMSKAVVVWSAENVLDKLEEVMFSRSKLKQGYNILDELQEYL